MRYFKRRDRKRVLIYPIIHEGTHALTDLLRMRVVLLLNSCDIINGEGEQIPWF